MPNALSRVLCVDDDEGACEMLSMLLKAHGVEVTCVPSASQARFMMNTRSFDLYMLDAWLPETDGFEFCREIRKFDSRTPIIFYSGAAYDTDIQKGLAAGANAYVTKPDVEVLLETISDLIAKAKTNSFAAPWQTDRLETESFVCAEPFRVASSR